LSDFGWSNSPGKLDESGVGDSGTFVLAGAGVDGVELSLAALLPALAPPRVTALLVFAVGRLFPAFFAGAFRAVVRAALFVVLFAPPFFAAGFADLFTDFLAAFAVDFFAAELRDRAFVAPLFFELRAAPFRAPFAFLVPFFAAIFRPLL
jgi:hypothetical protein